MKVRKLSSKCLVSLQENPHSAVSWMLKIVDKIEKEENSSNQLHGFLLQVISHDMRFLNRTRLHNWYERKVEPPRKCNLIFHVDIVNSSHSRRHSNS